MYKYHKILFRTKTCFLRNQTIKFELSVMLHNIFTNVLIIEPGYFHSQALVAPSYNGFRVCNQSHCSVLKSVVSLNQKCFSFGCKLLCFRVIFRGWEWSHSIRSEILNRYWCPDFFKKKLKKYFWSIFQILTYWDQIVIENRPIVAKIYYFWV